jgi:oxygen-independent coproporphyrinogen-3 oxidase
LPLYEASLNDGLIPTLRGHVLTEEDQIRRRQILKLMTEFKVDFLSNEQKAQASDFLAEMIKDHLVTIEGNTLRVLEAGRPFLRNACVFFDERLKVKQPQTRIFSQSI